MFKKIKEFIFNNIAKKRLTTIKRNRKFVNYNDAKSIFILFESDFSEKNQTIRNIIRALQQDNKKVTAWGYINKKEVNTAILPDFRILHHKQTNFFLKPDSTHLTELENIEFDLLIDLSLNQNLTLQYISLYANALCKVGVRNLEPQIYDFIIDIENLRNTADSDEETIDETYLFKQIIFYLKSIQSND